MRLRKYDSNSGIFLNNQQLLTIKYKDKYFLIHAIPYESELGQNNLKIKINNNISHLSFNVKEKVFDTQDITIIFKACRTWILITKRESILERKSLQEAKNIWYNQAPDLKFITPANGIVTGRFGTERFYNGKKGINWIDTAETYTIFLHLKGKILTGIIIIMENLYS